MANIKSIKKVKDYLEKEKRVVSLSEISRNVNLSYNSIRECLKLLQETKQIYLMTSKGTTLVQNCSKEKQGDIY